MKRFLIGMALITPATCLLLSGCVDTTPMFERAAMQGLANAVNAPVPGGKATPALSVSDMQHYQAVVDHYRTLRNNPDVFNTNNALPCTIDQDTVYLISQNQPANVAKSLMRVSDRSLNRTSTLSPIEVSVLSGDCANGTFSGPFSAIVQNTINIRMQDNTQQRVSYSSRIDGQLINGEQQGLWQSITYLNSLSEALGAGTTGWSAHRYSFENNQITGTQMTYSEFPQFNSLTVTDSGYGNELRRVRTYTGEHLSTAYSTFQGAIYGWFFTFYGGQQTGSSCMWNNQTVGENNCLRFNTNAPFTEFVGIGIGLPPNLNGRFQIYTLSHPSAASHAGLTVGDTILAIDGEPLTAGHNSDYVQQRLRGAEGTDVAITVLKEGELQSTDVTLRRSGLKSPALAN